MHTANCEPHSRRLAGRVLLFIAFFGITCLGAYYGLGLGWRGAQFFFAYQELGFVRRGFPATLLYPFSFLRTRTGIEGIVWTFLFVFAFNFSKFFLECTERLTPKRRWALALCCALSPGLFVRLGYDFGRFDILGLIWAIAAFSWIEQRRWMVLSLTLSALVLSHEAAVIIHLPIIIAYARIMQSQRNLQFLRRDLCWLCLPGLAFAAVMIGGRFHDGLDVLTARFQADAEARNAMDEQRIDPDALAVLSRTFRENIDFNIRSFFPKMAWLHLAIIIPWFCLPLSWTKSFYRKNSIPLDLLFYVSFSPLLLSLIAIDYSRWVALSSINLLFAVLLHCRIADDSSRVELATAPLTAALLSTFLLGPISNTKSFPLFFTLLQHVLPWDFTW